MSRPILEVIALTPQDAVAAERGGADRLEITRAMADGGLTPDRTTLAAIRDAVELPLRVMVRCNPGYTTTAGELDAMLAEVAGLRSTGVAEFVFGLLTEAGEVDVAACGQFAAAIAGCPWTFHRALDHAADRAAAWRAVAGLPGVDTVLTAGSPRGVGDGLAKLRAEAGNGHSVHLLVGGGLKADHVPALLRSGVDHLHIGGAARLGGTWDGPVDAAAVRRWRTLLDPVE